MIRNGEKTGIQLVCLQNDEVYDSLMDMKWNLLPIPFQKEYSMSVKKAQTPTFLTAGGVIPLNMGTFILVILSIPKSLIHRSSYLTVFLFSDYEENLWSDHDAGTNDQLKSIQNTNNGRNTQLAKRVHILNKFIFLERILFRQICFAFDS